jgi:hypothetical protein
MWLHESERIGKQKCTPTGYALHVIADYFGFFAMVTLVSVFGLIAYRAIFGPFTFKLLWLIPVPFGLAVLDTLIFHFSWYLAKRRGFYFDHETCVASWDENGRRRTYDVNSSGPNSI